DPGTYRSGCALRPRHWYFRNGLLRRDGSSGCPCGEEEAKDGSYWVHPPCQKGGHDVVVQAALRRHHPEINYFAPILICSPHHHVFVYMPICYPCTSVTSLRQCQCIY
ncbi:hypothetical protein RSAG8_06590, partial [Rhizoctonia solani AG-8 WAC10335]